MDRMWWSPQGVIVDASACPSPDRAPPRCAHKEITVARTRAVVCSLLAASMVTAAAGIGVAAGAGAAGSKSNPIKAQATQTKGFNPGKVTVKAGSKVYFKNLDGAPHNAFAAKKGKLPGFTSGTATSKNFTLTAPKVAGTYSYICQVHPFMKGTLVVTK
jgi:plastocyanin